MTQTELDGNGTELGPVDYLIIEFRRPQFTGEGVPHLLDLVDRAVIRVLDLAFVMKGDDGAVRAIELKDVDGDGELDLAVVEGAASGLLDDEDLDRAGGVLEPGSGRCDDLRERLGHALGGHPTSWWRTAGGDGADPCRASHVGHSGLTTSTPRTGCTRGRKDEAMPGLLRAVARTAAISGTATAVSNRVSRRQAGRWAVQEQQQASVQPAAAQPVARPSAIPDTATRLAQLKELGELQEQGILSPAEFAAEKSRILSS